MIPGIEQDIKEALLQTKEITSKTAESLIRLGDAVKKIMEDILSQHYQENAELKKLAAPNAMNPAVPENMLGKAEKESVQKLKDVHHELTETNMQIQKNETVLTMLNTDQPGHLSVKKALDAHVNDVTKIGEVAKKAEPMFHKLAMLLGENKPKSIEKLNAKLDEVYKELHTLKLKLKQDQTMEPPSYRGHRRNSP